MTRIDLNCDLGESFGAYTIGMDSEVLPYITSANIACGFHAGDPLVMAQTVHDAVKNGVSLGAHPGLPDIMGFGRRVMKITPAEAEAYIVYQTGALSAFAHAAGTGLHHVKPHGALYNMAAGDDALAEAVCRGVGAVDEKLILVVLSGSCMQRAAERLGIRYACEVFADRAYTDEGTLVVRSKQGAVITDENEVIKRAVRMVKDGIVCTESGKEIHVQADTICVHGDNPKALQFVKNIRASFTEAQIEVMALPY
ncbi:MAG: 5-oxoprolinase subunit PxpA [Treponema sp.]|nr:5-oxoprolinase subunit PxpA [Treponema sp.]